MSGDTDSAPKPDPTIASAAKQEADLGQQYLDFAKNAYTVSQGQQSNLDALTSQVQQAQLGVSNEQLQEAQQDRARYESEFVPVEDQFVQDATSYDTPAKQAEAAAEAGADVQSQAAISKGTAERQAAGLGINPASGRYAGIDRAADLGTSLATAGAENTARQNTANEGLQLEDQVAQLGRSLPTQAAAEDNLGLTAGSTAVGLGQANQNLSNAATSIVGSGYQDAAAGLGQEANTLSGLYSQDLNAWNAQQASNSQDESGLFGALGTAAGGLLGSSSTPWIVGALSSLSSKELKTNKAAIPDGKALTAVKAMPVEAWNYKPGVADAGAHVGPYAEDFQAATGAGDGRTIPLQDQIGVTMRAVQDLAKDVEALSKAAGLGGTKKSAGAATPTGRKPVGLAQRYAA